MELNPGNIVGAIANEVDLDSKHIGSIEMFENYSLVDLPEGMPQDTLQILKRVKIFGQKLNISKIERERTGEKRKKPRTKNSKANRSPRGRRRKKS